MNTDNHSEVEMTEQEYSLLVKDLSVDMIRRNESFTMVFGHEAYSRLSCHIYYDHTIDKICIYKYRFIDGDEFQSIQKLDTIEPGHVFFKRVYPEASDYSSIRKMIVAGWDFCFSDWSDRVVHHPRYYR